MYLADVHDLDQLDADAARVMGDLARRATEHSTALRVIGDEPAVLIPLLSYAQAGELKICDSSGRLQCHHSRSRPWRLCPGVS